MSKKLEIILGQKRSRPAPKQMSGVLVQVIFLGGCLGGYQKGRRSRDNVCSKIEVNNFHHVGLTVTT